MGLTISFAQFLTMIIKFFDQVIKDGCYTNEYMAEMYRRLDNHDPEASLPESIFKLFMVMNTDGSATLRFIKSILEFKDLEQLSLDLKLGEMSAITDNVQYRYNYSLAEYQANMARLENLVRKVNEKNPSMIVQML